MIVTFFDREDETNHLSRTVIGDNDRLFQILEGLRNRLPFFCELVGENGFHLMVGVGEMGCVQYSRCDGTPPHLVAIADSQQLRDGYSEFLINGTPTPVPNRFCMPFDSILEIVGYFRETGRAHPECKWEEI
jgi:hypothetical protein